MSTSDKVLAGLGASVLIYGIYRLFRGPRLSNRLMKTLPKEIRENPTEIAKLEKMIGDEEATEASILMSNIMLGANRPDMF
jgi:hypothetical protein